MKRSVRNFLRTTIILFTLGIFVQTQGQPVQVTEIPNNSSNFIKIGDLVYFTAGDALWRTDGTKAGTFVLTTGLGLIHELIEFNGMAIVVAQAANEVWRSDGTPDGTIRLKSFIGSGVR